ncbi:hypothetical protein GCM10008179_06610 [Hansschlegelia plantiphila]|uniref:Uncharacterized protein n=1 Tax=Hansschlegelia plantiphila TaxID=374655 RepID=A0A9W6IZN6_9HYPH|nr:hypothetical protein GCM10008179_06610 [Hansschlegelia plantiphila]
MMFKGAGYTVAFAGRGGEGVPAGGGSAAWAVRTVNVGVPGRETETAPASGVCRFEDPFKGRAGVWCSAKTPRGEFSATFRSDGRPPQAAR